MISSHLHRPGHAGLPESPKTEQAGSSPVSTNRIIGLRRPIGLYQNRWERFKATSETLPIVEVSMLGGVQIEHGSRH